jgi:hypothetical protein
MRAVLGAIMAVRRHRLGGRRAAQNSHAGNCRLAPGGVPWDHTHIRRGGRPTRARQGSLADVDSADLNSVSGTPASSSAANATTAPASMSSAPSPTRCERPGAAPDQPPLAAHSQALNAMIRSGMEGAVLPAVGQQCKDLRDLERRGVCPLRRFPALYRRTRIRTLAERCPNVAFPTLGCAPQFNRRTEGAPYLRQPVCRRSV